MTKYINDWVYDIESFPNFFSASFENCVTEEIHLFEISWRVNDLDAFVKLIVEHSENGSRHIGFNNIGYDYPLIHWILKNARLRPGCYDIYKQSKKILGTPWDQRFTNRIAQWDWIVPQIDLFSMHHFDNTAKSTGLKVLEFNMRATNIMESTVPFDTVVGFDKMDEVIEYNQWDVTQTKVFHGHSVPMIEFRETLGEQFGKNILNDNDTKIGKDHFISEIEKRSPGACYEVVDGKKVKRQTIREDIAVKDIIFPYVSFKHPEMIAVLDFLKMQNIRETKGVFEGLRATINGFRFDFGTGGIHGSIEPCVISADDRYMILDIDATSFYPWLAIANKVYPEHLGPVFCEVYEELFNERAKHAKKTVQNAALKLALNGSFGDTNSKFSALYDPQYAMTITINGQLVLAMLGEALSADATVEVIQVNTDGITIRCLRSSEAWVRSVMKWWEDLTGLMLEDVQYKRMMIRDVNSYIGEFLDGSLKRKGAYEYNLEWHKNHSSLVVQKAAEAALVHGQDIRDFIENHTDVFDFMLRTKVPRNSKLITRDKHGVETQQQNVSRYYVSILGDELFKVMPPLYNKPDPRYMAIESTWRVSIANNMDQVFLDDIEIEWYVQEAKKLVDTLR